MRVKPRLLRKKRIQLKIRSKISNSVSKSFEDNLIILESSQTLCGEIVYLKHVLEFKDKKKESNRDMVLEENLLDVKRLLKNSAISAAAKLEN